MLISVRFAGGGNSKPVIEQEILKQVQDDINFPLKRTYLQNRIKPLTLSHKGRGKITSRYTLHPSLKKKSAFTLAEVLITLGIIGVVAALTIPTLISKHQKKVQVTQLKKTVNTVSNGMKKILADNEVDSLHDTWLYEHLTSVYVQPKFNDYYKQYFNIVGTGMVSHSWKYSAIEGSGGFTYGAGYTFILADGSEIIFRRDSQYPDKYIVAIDINTLDRLPNILGKDFFIVVFVSNGNVLSQLVQSQGSHSHSSDSSQIYGDCRSGSNNIHAISCFEAIMNDNWEINYY